MQTWTWHNNQTPWISFFFRLPWVSDFRLENDVGRQVAGSFVLWVEFVLVSPRTCNGSWSEVYVKIRKYALTPTASQLQPNIKKPLSGFGPFPDLNDGHNFNLIDLDGWEIRGAPVDMENLLLLLRFQTSQRVTSKDFWSINHMTPNVWNVFSSYVPHTWLGGCFSDGKCSSPVEHLGLVYIKKHGNFLFNEPLMGEGLPGLHFVAPVDPKQIQDCPVSFEKLAV